MNFYYCDACHYCFESDTLPDRCPDCGAVEHDDKKAVRPASNKEIDELLRIALSYPERIYRKRK